MLKKILQFFVLLIPMLVLSCQNGENMMLPAITTSELSNITSISAISGGDIIDEGNSVIIAKGVCWSNRSNPTLSDHLTQNGAGVKKFTSQITGLEKGTTYYLRAYATSSSGTSYGNEIVFTTLVTGFFTDNRDGQEYGWVMIGDQVWMSENLAYLPDVSTPEWGSDSLPFYYIYGYFGTNVNEAKETLGYQHYGVLYNWPAAMNGAMDSNNQLRGIQGICPDGWHVPNINEWTELENCLGGWDIAGGKMKSTGNVPDGDGLWLIGNELATNTSGFNGEPGGYRYRYGSFECGGCHGWWWTSTRSRPVHAFDRGLDRGSGDVYDTDHHISNALSVRCVQD